MKRLPYTQENIGHYIGNPLFAIETSLFSLRSRLENGNVPGAIEVIATMEKAVEKAKKAMKRLEKKAK